MREDVRQRREVAAVQGGADLAEVGGELGQQLGERAAVDLDRLRVDAAELGDFQDRFLRVLPGAEAAAELFDRRGDRFS